MTSDWTVETLREHYNEVLQQMDLRYQQRYDAQNKALDAALLAAKEAVQTALLAAKEAVIKAEVATENRLTLLNELRAGVATREQIDGLTERQSDLKERLDRIEGKNSGIGSSWSILIGAISVIATVIIVIVTLTS